MTTIIFSGSGGQGIMSMGTMLAQAAIEAGKHAAYMPSYGPEQRGGTAKCVVIIDDEEIISPMAEIGDVLVAMSDQAYVKFASELKPGGTLLYDNAVMKSSIDLDGADVIPVPAGDLAIKLGVPRAANVIVDGVLVGLTGIVSAEEFQHSLDQKFASKSSEIRNLNKKALDCGLELAHSYASGNAG